MDISTKHENARIAACRIPSLNASLALLEVENPDRAHINFYTDPAPVTPGVVPVGAELVVSVDLAETAGVVDTEVFQIQLTVPIEAQVDGADPADGSTVTWAQIIDGDGDWWGDATVSDEAGDGEIKVVDTLYYNGAFLRVSSAVFQG